MERESSEHLRWTHLEQVQHFTNLPSQITFPAHTEQGKIGMNVTAHQQKKNEKTKAFDGRSRSISLRYKKSSPLNRTATSLGTYVSLSLRELSQIAQSVFFILSKS